MQPSLYWATIYNVIAIPAGAVYLSLLLRLWSECGAVVNYVLLLRREVPSARVQARAPRHG